MSGAFRAFIRCIKSTMSFCLGFMPKRLARVALLGKQKPEAPSEGLRASTTRQCDSSEVGHTAHEGHVFVDRDTTFRLLTVTVTPTGPEAGRSTGVGNASTTDGFRPTAFRVEWVAAGEAAERDFLMVRPDGAGFPPTTSILERCTILLSRLLKVLPAERHIVLETNTRSVASRSTVRVLTAASHTALSRETIEAGFTSGTVTVFAARRLTGAVDTVQPGSTGPLGTGADAHAAFPIFPCPSGKA
jgi:hypothetical protein